MVTIEKTIKELVFYAEKHLYLRDDDEIYATNILLGLFGKSVPYSGEIDEATIAKMTVPDTLLQEVKDYLVSLKMSEVEAGRKADFIMGLLTPRPSQVDDAFWSLYSLDPNRALAYLYDLGVKNDYIQKTKLLQNIVWEAHYHDAPSLLISINLSKPEKNNKDIAALATHASSDYPKCALCPENLGYYGDDKHPAREPLRYVPLTLAGERWYLQYSPYGYFKNHCIVFKKEHEPMAIEGKTFERLFDFVDLFPSFFMGSNSDLPIVGGSILNHEHFQGGSPVLPLFQAGDRERILVTKKGTTLSIVDFYVTALRLAGSSREDIVRLGTKLLSYWRNYSDAERDILSSSDGKEHNTVTSFARKIGNHYELILVLRNNRCTPEFPDGIFHAHPEYHAIKKEGIGLIEAAGLFILPARLLRETGEVEAVAKGEISFEGAVNKDPRLTIFAPMVEALQREGISSREYINRVCQGILHNVAVYKDDEKGQTGLHAFLKAATK